MLKRTEGVVLRTIPFGEADLIVTYLTPDLGLIKLFAKSPRKIRSRFGSSLEPLTRSRISFWGKEDSTLPRLTQSDIMHPFQSIRENLNCLLRISEMLELIINFVPEREGSSRVYTLLLDTLRNIEDNLLPQGVQKTEKGGFRNEDLIVNHYKIKFLELVGFAPRLDACGRCGSSGYSFYLSHGSVLCQTCAGGVDSPIKLSRAVVRFYSDLRSWDAAKINRLRPSAVLLSELSDVINIHIKYILSRPLKSEEFIHALSR
jgi:DNA repair protein RecO (recombination protein O)